MFTKLELVLMTLFVIVCISLVCEKAIIHAGLYILTLSNHHLEQVKKMLTTELHGLHIEGIFSE